MLDRKLLFHKTKYKKIKGKYFIIALMFVSVTIWT